MATQELLLLFLSVCAQVCRMVELCIPKQSYVFLFFESNGFWGKWGKIFFGDIAFRNGVLFLKIVTKWQEFKNQGLIIP